MLGNTGEARRHSRRDLGSFDAFSLAYVDTTRAILQGASPGPSQPQAHGKAVSLGAADRRA